MRPGRPLLAILPALLLGAGCASSTGTGGARVLAAGQQEVGVGLELTLAGAQISPSAPVGAPKLPQPSCLPCRRKRIAARGGMLSSSRPIWCSIEKSAFGKLARSPIQNSSACPNDSPLLSLG